jgi:hypothetical protein
MILPMKTSFNESLSKLYSNLIWFVGQASSLHRQDAHATFHNLFRIAIVQANNLLLLVVDIQKEIIDELLRPADAEVGVSNLSVSK